VDEIYLFHDRDRRWALENMTMNIFFEKTKKIVE
jgi:hypothetical protein